VDGHHAVDLPHALLHAPEPHAHKAVAWLWEGSTSPPAVRTREPEEAAAQGPGLPPASRSEETGGSSGGRGSASPDRP
jgi:hypothetical protein